MANYIIYDEGKTIRGNARMLLETIRKQNGSENKEIAKMDVDAYADALIEDAPYFLPDDLLEALRLQSFETKFDKALTYLGQMPTSGVRILTITSSKNGK